MITMYADFQFALRNTSNNSGTCFINAEPIHTVRVLLLGPPLSIAGPPIFVAAPPFIETSAGSRLTSAACLRNNIAVAP